MTPIFTINADNNVQAFASQHAADSMKQTAQIQFSSQEQLTAATAEWPLARFADIWNDFAGTPGFENLKPVKKFENRTKAIARVWAAIQVLASDLKHESEPAPAPKKQNAPKPSKSTEPKPAKEASKKDVVIRMLRRKHGATNEEIQSETGWQPHTVRGFIAGSLKKAGFTVESFKNEKQERRYRIAGVEDAA